jgi:hypothetical protein
MPWRRPELTGQPCAPVESPRARLPFNKINHQGWQGKRRAELPQMRDCPVVYQGLKPVRSQPADKI